MWETVTSNARREMVKIMPFLFDFPFVLSLFMIMNTR